jgi:hypothetical protein
MANTISNADQLNAANAYPVGLKMNVLVGTTATTNIAVTGIVTTDKIVSCVRVNRDATAANIDVADITSEVSITSAGNIQLSTTNTTGDVLLLQWWDKE